MHERGAEMKYLEHRRHSKRQDTMDNQSFLSSEGVALARRVGETMQDDYALVVTSILPRAIQTPIAMGYAVDETTDLLSSFAEGVVEEMQALDLSWSSGYANLRRALQPGTGFEAHCLEQLQMYRLYLDKIDEGETVLMVSHGGIIDFPLIAMFPDTDYTEWGEMLSYCEGFRVSYDGNKFGDLEFLRI